MKSINHFLRYSPRSMLYVLCYVLVIAGCATTSSSSRVNMGDPSTYVKVNFLKENYDEVIRYSRTLGVLNSANNRLAAQDFFWGERLFDRHGLANVAVWRRGFKR